MEEWSGRWSTGKCFGWTGLWKSVDEGRGAVDGQKRRGVRGGEVEE